MKLVLKLAFLPIRLAIGAVKLVAAMIAGLLGGIAMLALAPAVAVVVGGAAVVAVIVAVLALLLPLLPFLLLGRTDLGLHAPARSGRRRSRVVSRPGFACASGARLQRRAGRQQRGFFPPPRGELTANRQAIRVDAARQADCRAGRRVAGDGEDVGQVHLSGSPLFSPRRNAGGGDVGVRIDVALLQTRE